MTRPRYDLLILALAIGLFAVSATISTPAPRPAAVIPSASLGNVQGAGNGETDRRLAGAPDKPADDSASVAEPETAPSSGAPPFTLSAPRPQRHADATATPKPSEGPPVAPRRVVRTTARIVPRVQSKYGVPWLARSGIASHMGSGFPAGYLALPHGPGWRARICGADGCVTMTSNDAGPALYLQRQGRVADLSVQVFEAVCGVPRTMGLCPVSVTILGRANG